MNSSMPTAMITMAMRSATRTAVVHALAQMRAVVVAHNGHQAVAQAEHRHKDEGLQLESTRPAR